MTEKATVWILAGLSEDLKGKEFTIDRSDMNLGRTPDNAFVVPATNISRHHTSFFFRDGNLWVKDLGSKNGTFVNEQRIQETLLHPEDIVRVAEFRFRVAPDGGALPSTPDADIRSNIRSQQPRRTRPNHRALLYGAAIAIGAIVIGSQYADLLVPLLRGGVKKAAPTATPAIPTAAPRDLDATDNEILEWQVKSDAAVQFDDMAAAVSLLRKIIQVRPDDVRARALLARCEKRLRSLIATYDENAAREFEKLYYDRAIREWRKVLALSQTFDPDAYKKAEQRIRESEAELTNHSQP